ncbi:extracellular solute-binding protein [Paenibacillus sp. GYB004]|uniref:ABC transporter substrate-binding protein n=1 Tax=Paenibacillus sp. GYB004 TaxID=2994393 RepID=UPI002F965851
MLRNRKKKKAKLLPVAAALLLSVAVSACGGAPSSGNEAAPADPQSQKRDPVTLTFLYNGYSKELVDELKSKIETKFPHIKLNVMMEAKGAMLEDVIGSGTELDAVARTAGGVFQAMKFQVMTDLTPYIEKSKFDLNRFAPGVLESIKSYSPKGEILFMPYELNNTTLVYNKSIFDKFGVPYPKDGMTWTQIYDLTKQISRMEGGTKYKGIKLNALNMIYRNQLGLTFIDPKTFAPTVNTEQWKKYVETMTSFYTIPNNEPASDDDVNFFNRQTLAMRVGPSPLDLLPAAVEKGLDWDVVTLPHFDGMKDVGSQMNAPFFSMVPTSKHKEEVFEVLAYLVSDEIQAANSRKGRVSVLRSEQVMAEFGKDLPILQGKNIKAFTAEKIAKPIVSTYYDGGARSRMSQLVDRLVGGPDDLNTALRKAEEDIKKQITDDPIK